jgi:hypothetical protein
MKIQFSFFKNTFNIKNSKIKYKIKELIHFFNINRNNILNIFQQKTKQNNKYF